MNTRNIKKHVSPPILCDAMELAQSQNSPMPKPFLVQKQQLRRDVVHMHSLQESPSHTASSKRNIADIEQGQWWIQAEYRFCDIGSCFIHNSKADISWPVKKQKTFEIMWNSSSWMTIVPSWFYLQKNLKLNACGCT